jgi:glucan phosphoethanolaminetransferase (alkaline phosphatase superfamily)
MVPRIFQRREFTTLFCLRQWLRFLILFRQKWLTIVKDFCQLMAAEGWKRAAFVAAMLAITVVWGVESWRSLFIPLGFVLLAAALFITSFDRTQNPEKRSLTH